MDKCAKTQSQRNLSLKGKTLVINTCILPKVGFVSNVFPLHTYIILEIKKIIFGYLWKGSAAKSIARETLFLPRDRGGLGILLPLIEGLALRINYLIQLGKKGQQQHLDVSSKIHNFTPPIGNSYVAT